jgi:putative ABC transport system permease protein
VSGVIGTQPVRIFEQSLKSGALTIVASDTATQFRISESRGKSWQILDGEKPIPPDELASKPEIVLGENAARRLGMKAGDKLSLPTPKGPLELAVRAVIVDYVSQQGAGYIDRKLLIEHWGDDSLDAVHVYIDSGADPDQLSNDIRARIGGGETLFVTKTAAVREHLVRLLTEAFSYSRSVELITLIIALLGVTGTMIAAVLDRVREIGMIRAIGARRRQVVAAIMLEAGFLGFCAILAGAGIGVLQCLLFLDTVMLRNTGWHLNFVFPASSTARIAGLVLLTSAIAGLIPGYRAARFEVSRALSYE